MAVDSHTLLGSPSWYASTPYREPHMLSVVIPALNEEEGIAAIVQRVRAAERGLQEVGVESLEIIVVDDGSTDRTAEIVTSLQTARLLQHVGNRGYGAAIKSGFNSARGDLLAFLDADGTYPPECLPALCRKMLDQQADVVVGSRRSGAESQMPLVRRVGNFIWSNLVSLLGNQRVADPASGMRIVRREALPQLYPLPDGLHFTPVMSTRSAHEGLRVVEVPIPYAERLGRSKLSVVRDGTRFLTTILWTAMEYNPVRLLGTMSLVALGIVTFIVLSLVGLRLQGITTLGPWGVFSVFAALVLGVAGVSIFSLGATFNYLVALFHRRPVKQGLFGPAIFNPPLDRQFGWIGIVLMVVGATTSLVSLALSLNGWEITRLWLWMLGSALLILVGLQLTISWVVMRVLEALSVRESRIKAEMDLNGTV
jgi:hypothetical protein